VGRNRPNRRQQRLRDRREQPDQGAAPEAPRERSRQGTLSSKPVPGWRQTIDSWGGIPVLTAVVIAVIGAGFLIWLARPGASANTETFVPANYENIQQSGRTLGDPNAPVRIIEYYDFQCPFCKRHAEQTQPALIEEYVATGKAYIEGRDYAFLGSESIRAAEAAACAADQGQYWHFHDLLLLRQGVQNSGVFSDGNLRNYANQLQAEIPEFSASEWQTCFNNGTYAAEVRQFTQQAPSVGVQSTPTTIINGNPIGGAQPLDTYRNAIEAALTAAGAN